MNGLTVTQQHPRIWHVTRDSDGRYIGRILRVSLTRFRAARFQGTDDDVRRVGDGWQSIDTAAAWIAKAAL